MRWLAWFSVVLLLGACPSEDAASPDTSGDVSVVDPDASDPGDPDAGPDAASPSGWWERLQPSGSTIGRMLGVSTHMKQSAGQDARRDFEFDAYQALGGIRIREDYHWHKLEPADDEWHFEAVSEQVTMARERGVEILAMLAYGVEWAMPSGEHSTIDPLAYADYAAAVAAELCADVPSFEIWNEPNLDRFWKPLPDPAHYGELLKAAHDAIKTACPEARVLTAGFASFDFVHPDQRWWFLREMYAHHPDLCASFDALALHPYTFAQEPPPEADLVIGGVVAAEGQRRMVAVARSILAEMGCPERPIWFTEMGWPSYALSEQRQALYLARSVLLAALDGVETTFWYTFWDGKPTTEGLRPHEAYFGLYGWPGEDGTERRAKPAWEALEALAARLGEARLAADLSAEQELPEDVYALAFVGPEDALTLALWDGRDVADGSTSAKVVETSYALELPLPVGTTGTALYDVDGALLESSGPAEALSLTLGPSMMYLVIER